jgi:hypothetical protein
LDYRNRETPELLLILLELLKCITLRQNAETRAADRAARYATRANRANAPPQQHHLAQGIALGN